MKRGAIIYYLVQVLGFLTIFALCIFLVGCRSVQVSESVNVRDSIVTNYRDSIIWHHRDSVHLIEHHVTLSDSSHLVIHFGQGGGTFNANTGEATNVSGVSHTDTHREQRDSTSYFRNLVADYKHTADSLTIMCSLWQADYERAEMNTRSGFDRFCSWWFWITAILLVIKLACWVMEKVPTTAPYIYVIRKFVPFI